MPNTFCPPASRYETEKEREERLKAAEKITAAQIAAEVTAVEDWAADVRIVGPLFDPTGVAMAPKGKRPPKG